MCSLAIELIEVLAFCFLNFQKVLSILGSKKAKSKDFDGGMHICSWSREEKHKWLKTKKKIKENQVNTKLAKNLKGMHKLNLKSNSPSQTEEKS